MLPLKAISLPHLLKFIIHLIAFDRLVYMEIELIALTLMTSFEMIKHHSNNEQTLVYDQRSRGQNDTWFLRSSTDSLRLHISQNSSLDLWLEEFVSCFNFKIGFY